jgi:hypothetical protein
MKLDLSAGQIWRVEAYGEDLIWKFEIVGKVIRKRRVCWIAVKKFWKIPGQLDIAVFDDRGNMMNPDGHLGGIRWFLVERTKG